MQEAQALAFLAQCFDVAGLVFSAVHLFRWGAQREHLCDGGHLGQNYELRVSCVLSPPYVQSQRGGQQGNSLASGWAGRRIRRGGG